MRYRFLLFPGMGLVHLLLFLFTYVRKKDARILPLLLSNIGFAHMLEYVIFNIFRSYRYKPGLLQNKHFDNMLGAMVSQSVVVPAAATFLTAFRIGKLGRAGYTVLLALSERLFIRLGLFRNYWWRTIYTLLLVPIGFWVSDQWYRLLGGSRRPAVVRAAVLLLSAGSFYTNAKFLLAVWLDTGLFRTHVVRNRYRDHFIGNIMYIAGMAPLAILPAIWPSVPLAGAVLLCMHAADQLLYRLRILRGPGWVVYSLLPLHVGAMLLARYVDRLLPKYDTIHTKKGNEG
ncbi:hypothetical protein [Ectobacillus ponti]|uniref:Uncharacterized protein n=1 Tax=Ectobacillus ponti TaxID=2961894 RepID=A0AA42BPC3_9BACI|nr:hypothetical protein [Ectobacillus ponti]MCP8968607.1 hypothetical protein [Ectobacillus ponti]